MARQKEYDGSKIHLSLAGSGNPWSTLTKLRKRILRELHDTPDINELALLLEMNPEELIAEIQPMMEVSLVYESKDGFRPSFLITDETETRIVYNHATEFSKILVEKTETHLQKITNSYQELELSKSINFEDIALLLVGGRILDIKLLEKLTRGNRVMPPAPSRPSPNRPDAHYYFFMVEGDSVHLGGYGQDDSNMPWKKWYFITFGQNIIDGKENPDRRELEEKYAALIKDETEQSPEAIGITLGIPVVNLSDSNKWEKTADTLAEILCQSYEEHEDSFKVLHSELKSGQYAPHSYGEFLCWYSHIAYASAIDLLEKRGTISIPPSRFQAAIWCRERENEGMLSEL